MENFIKTDFFRIEEQGNQFIIQRKKAPKKMAYFMLVSAFLYGAIFFFENNEYSYLYLLGILYSIYLFIWYLRIKESEVIKKQDIKSLKMKNGLFNFNTTLVITLNNGRKIRLYFQNEKDTKRTKFLLESPIRFS